MATSSYGSTPISNAYEQALREKRQALERQQIRSEVSFNRAVREELLKKKRKLLLLEKVK